MKNLLYIVPFLIVSGLVAIFLMHPENWGEAAIYAFAVTVAQFLLGYAAYFMATGFENWGLRFSMEDPSATKSIGIMFAAGAVSAVCLFWAIGARWDFNDSIDRCLYLDEKEACECIRELRGGDDTNYEENY